MKENSGFTTVEIIIIAMILLLLAVIALPNYLEARDQVRMKHYGNVEKYKEQREKYREEMRLQRVFMKKSGLSKR